MVEYLDQTMEEAIMLEQTLTSIEPADQRAYQAAKEQWDSIAKPLGSLGLLEEAVCRMAGATGNPEVEIHPRAVVVFCADNGVVTEGVTQTGSEVTAIVAENLCRGETSMCRMAQMAHCDVIPVDVGMNSDPPDSPIRRRKPRYGTDNMAKGPAMTPEDAISAMEAGIWMAKECHQMGYRLLAAGEMGIGNTTTSAAVASVLLEQEPAAITGRGAGLSDQALTRKIGVIQQAIAVNAPDPEDIIDVLAKVGGLDIAALCGFYLGAAVCRLPVILDGLISGVAALCAFHLCRDSRDYMLASHCSIEPAAGRILEKLGLRPLISAEMRLGEGSGAVALLPLLDMALAAYRDSATFHQSRIPAYTPQS